MSVVKGGIIMQVNRVLSLVCAVSMSGGLFSMGGCDRKHEPAKPVPSDAAEHKEGDGHIHSGQATEVPRDTKPGNDDEHHSGVITQLGEQSAGGYVVKASHDGEIVPGKDAAIDVWVTGGPAKVAAVRFWIGTQDAKGSVKARAEIERDNWHTHAEVPNPLPAGSRLWVEVETEKGEKTVVGFDLKR